jgi:hypothetical protein
LLTPSVLLSSCVPLWETKCQHLLHFFVGTPMDLIMHRTDDAEKIGTS